MKKSMGVVLLGLVLGIACATRVNIAMTHREDINAQARPLAISAGNLENATRGRGTTTNEVVAAQAISTFHSEAENFARQAGRWHSTDDVNGAYERMIEAYVRMEKTFPDLKPDAQVTESYKTVQHNWELLARKTGYAGKHYQKKLEDR